MSGGGAQGPPRASPQQEASEIAALQQQLADARKATEAEAEKRKEAEQKNEWAKELSGGKSKERAVWRHAPMMTAEAEGMEVEDGGIRHVEIANYPGGLPLTQDIVRLAAGAHLLPPLSTLTPDWIGRHSLSGKDLLPVMSATQEKDVKEAKRALLSYYSLDQFIPYDQLVIALTYAQNLVVKLFGKGDAFESAAYSAFTSLKEDIAVRLVNPGSYIVVRAYALAKISAIRTRFETMTTSFPKELFRFDRELFASVSAQFGFQAAEQATTFHSTIADVATTPWARLVEMIENDKDAKKIDTARFELLNIQRRVLEGLELDGRLPAILGISSNSISHGGGGGGALGGVQAGGSAGRSYQDSGPRPGAFANPRSNDDDSFPPSKRPFLGHCCACGEQGHHFERCNKTKLRVQGRDLVLNKPDQYGKWVVCRSFNINGCRWGAAECAASHSCGKCGKPNAPVLDCSHS